MHRIHPVTVWLIMVVGCVTVSVAQDDSLRTTNASRKLPANEQKVFLTGYIKLLNTIAIPAGSTEWLFDNFMHNRLNFKWYITDNITVKVEARSRFFFGESNKVNPMFADQVNTSLDYIALGGELAQGDSYLLNSFIDRAYIDWYRDQWQVVIGKQRINWGKSYVWNPNDIFNAYSFFDFDYEERRGTDAILIKYNISNTSSIEAASNIEENIDLTTMAAKYNMSKAGYDFQFLGGKYQTDVVAGLGWAGQIKSAGFKGEVSYFHPYLVDSKSSTVVADISFDYFFPSTLNFRIEAIYHSNLSKPQNNLFFLQPVTAKQLTYNHYSLFTSAGYDITPLITANVNGIWYIDDQSFFINPIINFNLSKNTEFLLAAQFFGGTNTSTFGNMGSYIFTRLKSSF